MRPKLLWVVAGVPLLPLPDAASAAAGTTSAVAIAKIAGRSQRELRPMRASSGGGTDLRAPFRGERVAVGPWAEHRSLL